MLPTRPFTSSFAAGSSPQTATEWAKGAPRAFQDPAAMLLKAVQTFAAGRSLWISWAAEPSD
jgi:hypothetical protein